MTPPLEWESRLPRMRGEDEELRLAFETGLEMCAEIVATLGPGDAAEQMRGMLSDPLPRDASAKARGERQALTTGLRLLEMGEEFGTAFRRGKDRT